MKGLQYRPIIYYVGLVRETFSQCNYRQNLANVVPHGKSSFQGGFAACVESVGLCMAYIGLHDDQRRPCTISKDDVVTRSRQLGPPYRQL